MDKHQNSKTRYLFLSKVNEKRTQEILLPHTEIVKVGEKFIPYPCDRVKITEQDFQKVNHLNPENDPRTPKQGDELLAIRTLFPPITINLRKDALEDHKDTRHLLTEAELNYLHRNQSLAVLFIHGFNIAYGDYSRQIVDIDLKNHIALNTQEKISHTGSGLIYSNTPSTILRTQAQLEKELNNNIPFNFQISDEELNGTGAHNWFVHMENNINEAAERTKTGHYGDYFRIINITWSGDVPVAAYLDAENRANEAGLSLVTLLEQLIHEKMEIYIIAHSLGARVALTSMNALAENGYEDAIKQVFLWQAAVSDSALSNNPQRDQSVKYNNHFPSAYLSVQKISVLYSKNDWVLRFQYWLANRIGMMPSDLFNSQNPYELLYRFMDQSPIETLVFAKLINDDFNSFINLKNNQRNLDLVLRALKECYRASQTSQAMGYHGVDTKDPLMQKLIKSSKLMLINQSFLHAHSDMKIPNENVMNLAYKRWIVNKQHGISKLLDTKPALR
ncbi:MAG TPA: alpha/beta hydrolase [Coxiellaceae bacterium]|nr:alpha/beta hydrolase [Coxiellaceae bacterium]